MIDELSEFFKTLSDNFLSVKTQMDQVRGEYDRLSQQSREQRQVSKQEKSQQLEVSLLVKYYFSKISHRKLKRNGTLRLQ